jgi:hypothetical protein
MRRYVPDRRASIGLEQLVGAPPNQLDEARAEIVRPLPRAVARRERWLPSLEPA